MLKEVAEHFDEMAARYSLKSRRGLWGYIKQKELDAVMEMLFLERASYLLDIGCGAGVYLAEAARRKPGIVSEGCDISLKMVQAAQDRGHSVVHSGFAGYQPKKVADRIVCTGVLEFSHDADLFFDNAKKWLLPGGRLVLLIPETGFPGKIYKLYHRANGLKIRVEPLEFYCALAESSGFQYVNSRSIYSFSRAISFVRN